MTDQRCVGCAAAVVENGPYGEKATGCDHPGRKGVLWGQNHGEGMENECRSFVARHCAEIVGA